MYAAAIKLIVMAFVAGYVAGARRQAQISQRK